MDTEGFISTLLCDVTFKDVTPFFTQGYIFAVAKDWKITRRKWDIINNKNIIIKHEGGRCI